MTLRQDHAWLNALIARWHHLGLLARFSLAGMLIASLLTIAAAWSIEAYLTDLALASFTDRVTDQVRLVILEQVTAADLTQPATSESVTTLATRLDPLLRRLQDSGVIRLHLFDRAGTIRYSDIVSLRGTHVPVAQIPLLQKALSGTPSHRLSSLNGPESAALKARYGQALEVYLPITLDGQIVGAYEAYADVTTLTPLRPAIWGTVALSFALLLLALMVVVRGAEGQLTRQNRRRQQAEADGQQTRASLHGLLENTTDAIWSVDYQDQVYRVAFFNSALKTQFQRAFATEIRIGAWINDLLPADQAAVWLQFYERARTNGAFVIDYSHSLDGIIYSFEVAFNPIVTAGQFTGVCIFAKDITARKLAEDEIRSLNVELEQRVHERTAQLEATNRTLQQEIADRIQWQVALRESEERFRRMSEVASEALVIHRNGRILDINLAYERMFGFTAAELYGASVYDRIAPQSLALVQANISRGFEQPYELFVVRKDGSTFPVEGHGKQILLDGEPARVTIMRDLTERKRAEAILREREQLLQTIVDNAPLILWAWDQDGVFTLSEGKGLASIGRTAGASVNQSVFHLYRDNPAVLESARRVLSGESFAVALPVADRLFETWHVPIRNPDGQIVGAIGVATDITERTALQRQLEHQALHDPLTSLPNRLLFMERLRHALVRGRRNGRAPAVLFVDLDRFKIINDSLGHGIGDQLLIAVAGRLRLCVREEDTVARLGGDEFVLLLEGNTPDTDAVRVAERINQRLPQPIVLDTHEIVISASVGIYLPTDGDDDAEDIVRSADVAMYRAKGAGRGRSVIFDPSMRAHVVDRMELEGALRRALDQQELRVYFQPIIDLTVGHIVGLEALVRWAHPQRGLISPVTFIPLAEETGLILPIGRWVLTEACRQVHTWRCQGLTALPLGVSVNLSARQFQHPQLVDDMQSVLAETGLEATALTLELTESMIIEEAEANIVRLHELKQLGLRLAIDDFGTGYSSLSYLRRFPVDMLKIDRSFISRLGENSEDTAIVQTVISLAKTLGLAVTAEGVENQEQISALLQLGCPLIQGFFFAQPLSSVDLEEHLRRRLNHQIHVG